MVTEVLFQQRPLVRNRCGGIFFHRKTSPVAHLVSRNWVQQNQEGSEAVMRRESDYHETRGGKKAARHRFCCRCGIARTLRRLRELAKGAVDDFEAFVDNGVARFARPRLR